MKFEVGPDQAGTRLDRFLSGVLPDRTRSQLQGMNRRGAIEVGGKVRKDGFRLRAGDVIEVRASMEPPVDPMAPEAIPLAVHYEEESFAVVEKPAGMVVHPGAGNPRGTLANALMARFADLSGVGGTGRPGIVHRLDRWTSGLILVAKTDRAHARLSESFKSRAVRKTYVAAVHGRMASDEGTIDLPIRRHPAERTKMATDPVRGRAAHSEFRVIERIPAFCLLEVAIRTGRTHQIRVHLASIGHPVLGDAVYGEKQARAFDRRYGPIGRYFLHAARLGFPHPESGEWVEFNSPVPAELTRVWRQLAGKGG